MQISKVSVRELFGIQTFSYDIDLKVQQRITIIHGPNGSGKTVLFKMIDGLFNRHYLVFWKYPFREFSVHFDNKESIIVKRDFDTKTNQYEYPEISYSRSNQPFKLEINKEFLRYFAPSVRHKISSIEYQQLLPFFSDEPAVGLESYDTIQELILRYGENFFTDRVREPKWLRTLQDRLKVNFINTNRLLVNKPDTNTGRKQGLITVTAITENSKNLSSRIQEKILEADTQAKILDRTFPSRVVNSVVAGRKRILNYDTIREELDKLEKKRKRLTEAGLLESGTQEAEFQIPESIANAQQERTLRSVLTMYIKDTEEKLQVYQQLADKIELFKDIIQGMLRHKKLHISKNGFQLRSDAGQPIPLEELSSGEQHLLSH